MLKKSNSSANFVCMKDGENVLDMIFGMFAKESTPPIIKSGVLYFLDFIEVQIRMNLREHRKN